MVVEKNKMTKITVETTINAPIREVWEKWITPSDIKEWCHASSDWGVGEVTNEVRVGGKFSTIMRSLDGKNSFDFNGVYTNVEVDSCLEYTLEGGRNVSILFESMRESTKVTETFDSDDENPIEMQRDGWQAILDNFKRYSEGD